MDKEILFDTHGITGGCPQFNIYITSDECLKCEWNRGSHGFTMFCGYVTRGHIATAYKGTIGKLAITDDSKESLIVEHDGVGFWLKHKVKGLPPNYKPDTIIMSPVEAKQVVYFILHHILGT